jgi:hypothetical protein
MSSPRIAVSALLAFALLTNTASAQVGRTPLRSGSRASESFTSEANTVRPAPIGGERQSIRRSLVLPDARSLPPLATARQTAPDHRRDSVWNGALIGAGIGAGGGYVWAHNICGSNDDECFAIAGPVGILSGIGIGAALGAVADALHK